jgi:hypothetical protein
MPPQKEISRAASAFLDIRVVCCAGTQAAL